MKKNYFLLAISFSVSAFSQQTISAGGGDGAGPGGSFSFTVGQIDYLPFQSTTHKIFPGVQQPFEIQTVLGTEVMDVNLEMKVYPNPTTDILNLTVKNRRASMEYALFDSSGKMIKRQDIRNEITEITMRELSTSIYILQVSENGTPLKSFKIIKK